MRHLCRGIKGSDSRGLVTTAQGLEQHHAASVRVGLAVRGPDIWQAGDGGDSPVRHARRCAVTLLVTALRGRCISSGCPDICPHETSHPRTAPPSRKLPTRTSGHPLRLFTPRRIGELHDLEYSSAASKRVWEVYVYGVNAIDDLEATHVGAIQTKRQARKTDNHHPEHWTVGL